MTQWLFIGTITAATVLACVSLSSELRECWDTKDWTGVCISLLLMLISLGFISRGACGVMAMIQPKLLVPTTQDTPADITGCMWTR